MVVYEGMRQQYFAQGYYVLRHALSVPQVERARDAVRHLAERAAAPGGPELPWINRDRRLPDRLSGLLRPDYFEPAFAEHLEDSLVIATIEGLLKRTVRLSLFGMLAGGEGRPYVQGWHRDAGEVENDAQLAQDLARLHQAMQLNLPLYPDHFLQLVPGSHRRRGTTDERAAVADGRAHPMPGAITLHLNPGDCVFYWPQVYHRGFNPEGHRRWTFHHAFWAADWPVHAQELCREYRLLPGFGPVTRRLVSAYLAQLPAGDAPQLLRSR